jgi:DNA helicase II / ATP-dependent DNA helicase PcrA
MTFSDRYAKLNIKQKEAVDTIYGPVLVIAWPGSGKTELLAVRIANILRETDAGASNILCITFTEAAARNMRDRLRRIIGQEAYKVGIHTFHSFGLEVLNRFRHRLQEDEDLTPIDDIESSRIFHEMIESLEWDHPWKRKSRLGTLKNTIGELKKAGISPEDFREMLDINDQILNHIRPIIEKSHSFLSLGQKKEEKIEKVSAFIRFRDGLREALSSSQRNHGLHETLAPVFLRSLDEVIESIEWESDTKPITAWKNTWLEKYRETYRLKDEEKQIDSRELLSLYEWYEKALKERSLIDFSDMILRAIALVETDDAVRANLAEQYQWIMVDEYQDTNDAQLRLVTSLTSVNPESPNIFAVGDDDQSIYKFQWANTRNIRIFHDIFPDTRLIILEENYRSKASIIEKSRKVMDESTHSIGDIFAWEAKSFQASRWTWGEVEMLQFPTEAEELVWVARDIEKLIQEWTNPREIAVITKKNGTLEHIAKLLLARHIPVYLSKDEDIFTDEIVSVIVDILVYIDSLSKREDRDELLIRILAHPMWQIHRLTLWELSRQIYRAKKEENKEWINILRAHTDKNLSKIAHFFIELSLLSETKRLEEIIDVVTGAHALSLPEDYSDEWSREQVSLDIDGESRAFISPIYEYYFSEEKLRADPALYAHHLANVRKLIESVRSYRKTTGRLTLRDFSHYISLIHEYEISLSTESLIGDEHAVQCITAHKAKWLEYEHVYAIGLTEKQYKRGKNSNSPLPRNLPLTAEKDDDEDIRRLIYTVMTRAKDRLVMTYAEKSLTEKWETLISVLAWLGDEWQKNTDTITPEDITPLLELEYRDLASLPYTGDERSFLTSIIDSSFSLSATALQNFLDVTSGWPTTFLANNVLRFPQAKSSSASYGTAMHKALEDFFRDYKVKWSYKRDILFTSFEKKIRDEGLDEVTERDMLARGKANLEKLYENITKQSYGEIHLEHRFNDVYLEDIKITGAIDRIELTSDGWLIVTDYKTGEGFDTLEGGSGYEAVKKWKYRLQLTFYALLFSLSPRWSAWKTREFRLFFIEENRDTGEFHEVIEYIQGSEIERMKHLITHVMEKIRSLDFPDISKYEESVKGIRQFEEDILSWQV